MKNKKTLPKIIKIIAFFVVLAVLLEALSMTAFSKQKGGAAYRNMYNKTYSFYFEPQNSVQILGIGNSDLYSGFVPTHLYERFGFTSQMTGSPRQTPLHSYYYLKEILKYQSPEIVMIEVDMLYDDLPGENTAKTGKLDALFDYADPDDFQALVESKLSVFTFHDRWKSGLNHKTELRTPNSHGYKYFTATKEVDAKPYMMETDEREPIKQNRLRQFDKLVKLARENGAEVFFIEMPTLTSWNYARHNAAAALAEQYGTTFIDLNLCIEEMGLDLENSFRDSGNHLNYAGACTVTEYLGAYIQNTYALTPHFGDERWEESVKAFETEMKNEDKRRAEQDEE